MAYIIYILSYFISFYTVILQKIITNNHMNFNTVEKSDTFDHTILVTEKSP